MLAPVNHSPWQYALRTRHRGSIDNSPGFPHGVMVKNPLANAGNAIDRGLIPVSGRFPSCWRIPWVLKEHMSIDKIIHVILQAPEHMYIDHELLLAAAAAKLLQSCPTLCDPIDGSPPGYPIPGILQARKLEWVANFFSNAWKWKVKGKSLSRVWLLATSWTTAYQAPPSMGFSRQEYWSGVPLPSPELLLRQILFLIIWEMFMI